MSNDETTEPRNTGEPESGKAGAEHRQVGPRDGGELVDVPGGDDETIRTLEHRQVPDGSGNDAEDPDRRPDEDEDRYDAG